MAKQDETNPPSPGGSAQASGNDKPAATGQASGAAASAAAPVDGVELLKADHRKVEKLFEEYKSADPGRKSAIIAQACAELVMHTRLEEEIFYPACRRAAQDEEPLNDAQVEHDSAKVLIADLLGGEADDRYRDAKFNVLAEQIKHHVAEEEKPGSGIFAKAKAAGVDTAALGKALGERKAVLQRQDGAPRPTPPVSLAASSLFTGQRQEDLMARQNETRRDERGRFTDDDRRSRGSGGRERDEYGRFASDDDDRSYRSRGGREEEGRGWHGDPEGHSEASRRGWAARSGEGRSFRDEDEGDYRSSGGQRDRDERGRFASEEDDRSYRSRGSSDRDRDDYGRFASDERGRGRSRDEDDDRGRPGWYGDSEGHARAAREGWEDRDDRSRSSMDRPRDEYGRFASDERGGRGGREDERGGGGRGRGGWFGDSEGHSQAARQGREERGGGGSRSRDEEDERRYRARGRGQGWSGDPEGHSEASRRGWENRR